jgi:insulin-like growth factor 2 mRNA-binding protein 1
LKETTFIYIPNTAVGAVIGTKGSHIRNIIKFSGANVKVCHFHPSLTFEGKTINLLFEWSSVKVSARERDI